MCSVSRFELDVPFVPEALVVGKMHGGSGSLFADAYAHDDWCMTGSPPVLGQQRAEQVAVRFLKNMPNFPPFDGCVMAEREHEPTSLN